MKPVDFVVKDRVKELRRVPANELVRNPKNWRKHPESQVVALKSVLKEVGFAGAELAIEIDDGKLMLLDGHARADCAGSEVVPVLVLDLTPAEADLLLATYDPIGAMANADKLQLEALLGDISTESESIATLLETVAQENGVIKIEETALKPLTIMSPPVMTWVLVGIPTVRFGEISSVVEDLALIEGLVLETTSNDG